ncbi:hypothetical protein T03_1174 [Trichinella britovi]|uniref:Uncharacterized protein n=1 Tax=Trichinella britovi TaxID=45882 RepID=A0A0V1CS81_TRIBR|nr:hypothetical protein T03_1174 [Trichinella britovi]
MKKNKYPYKNSFQKNRRGIEVLIVHQHLLLFGTLWSIGLKQTRVFPSTFAAIYSRHKHGI